jgi:hypothetical protein
MKTQTPNKKYHREGALKPTDQHKARPFPALWPALEVWIWELFCGLALEI